MAVSKKRSRARRELLKDLLLIVIGICIALFLADNGAIDWFVGVFGGGAVSSFFAGIFFTSAFTLAPASIALAHIADTTSPHVVALWGGLGAMFGDIILFFFIRDRFAGDLMGSMRPSLMKHILSSFHLGFMKWVSPILGALIIASPLPDEFGLTLMGISKVRLAILIPIAFVMNTIGLYGLIWFAGMI